MTNEQNDPAVLGPAERQVGPGADARWYCVNRYGLATLCKDAADAHETARQCNISWPLGGPHRAVLLVDAAELAWLRHALVQSWKLAEDRLQQLAAERAQALSCRDELHRTLTLCRCPSSVINGHGSR